MARAHATEPPDDRRADQIEVADQVENLVPDELVLVAQSAVVKDALAADHDGVVERAAQRQAHRAQLVDLLQEAEGAGPGNVLLVARRGDLERPILPRHHRAVEIDLEIDRKTPARHHRGGAPRVRHRDLLEDLEGAARCVLRGGPGALDEEDEGRGAAVHDRHFRSAQFDDGVVDGAAGQRGHQVLDGARFDVVVTDQGRAQGGFDDVRPGRRDLGTVHRAVAAEPNAGIRFGRMQGHVDLDATMETDTGAMNRILQCPLTQDTEPDPVSAAHISVSILPVATAGSLFRATPMASRREPGATAGQIGIPPKRIGPKDLDKTYMRVFPSATNHSLLQDVTSEAPVPGRLLESLRRKLS